MTLDISNSININVGTFDSAASTLAIAAVNNVLLYSPRTFATRSAAVTYIAANTFSVGAIIIANGFYYKYTGSGTSLPGMPGFVPSGWVSFYHFGATGDGSTSDNTAALNFVAYMNANPGFARLGRGNFLINAGTLDFTAPGIVIEGESEGNVANLTPSVAAPTIITITGTGAGIRSREQANIFRYFRLTSDTTRAALSYDITQPGIRVEPNDTSTARADRNVVQYVRIDNQPGDGLLGVGGITCSNFSYNDIYSCKGDGIRLNAGTLTGIVRTNKNYPGLIDLVGNRVGYCGGHALSIADPSVTTQANMGIRIRVEQLDIFGCGSNTSIMYQAGDGRYYSIWIFGENCEVLNSAPCGDQGSGLTPEILGGIWIAGRDNRIVNNRFIRTAQPIYYGYISAQPSTGLTVERMRVVNTSLTHTDAIKVQDIGCTGIRVTYDRVEYFTNIITRRFGSVPVDYHASFGGKELHTNGLFSTGDELTIADDGVAVIPIIPSSGSSLTYFALTLVGSNNTVGGGVFHCRIGPSPEVTKWTGNANTIAGPSSGNGALTGTTGTDTFLNISCDATSLYIENRRGFSASMQYTISSIRRDAQL